MGLSALRKILAPSPFDPTTLAGKTVAVDADNLIWSFATALGASGDFPRAPDGRPIAHLYGLVGRLRLYAQWNVRSAWVFDGVQPDLKQATLVGRAERIEAARAAGNVQGGIEVSAEDLAECRALLDALGVPNMVAPGESDAQCAHLAQSGHAWAAVTQDWDIALFGAPRALRNLTGSKTRIPELLAEALAAAGLTREELVDAAILIGTDYNAGVPGVGPVKAIKLVKKHGTLQAALDALGTPMPEAETVRGLFLAHPVARAFRPRFAPPDASRALGLLAARGVSEDRARKLVDDLSRLHAPGWGERGPA
jgi:flap endonuclease-1